MVTSRSWLFVVMIAQHHCVSGLVDMLGRQISQAAQYLKCTTLDVFLRP